MKEQYIQSKILKWLKGEGYYAVNVIQASKAGVPDILASVRGRFIGIEVKLPNKKTNVSALQEYNLKAIKESGGNSIVVWDLNMVKEFIASLDP